MSRSSVLATLCYVQQNGKTLMMHRVTKENDVHEGKWNGLGGKFEPGESPEECLVREVEEEAGLQLEDWTMHGVLTFPEFDGKRDWYVFLFTTSEFRGQPPTSTREGNLRWIPNEELFELNLWDGDQIFLKWLNREGFFSGKFEYENGRLKDYESTFYPVDKQIAFQEEPTEDRG